VKVGLARTPALQEALRDAGIRPWIPGMQLGPGDILIIDPTLDPTALRYLRGLLLPDIEVLLVATSRARPSAAGWPWRRLLLPRDRDDLAWLRTVLPATTVLSIAGRLRPVRLRLEVRDQTPDRHCTARAVPPGDTVVRLRAAFDHTGLPWPHAAAVTVRAEPDLHPLDGSASLAVAAALLAATGAVPPAALRRHVLVGDVAPDGHLRALPHLASLWEATSTAGYRHLVAPAARATTPAGTVHRIATLADLVPLLRA
jgi:hypothetical protein